MLALASRSRSARSAAPRHVLPLWALVAVQAFRLPLEIAMHALVGRGIMPEQMSYTGRNFDIVTGASAIVVAALVATRIAGRRFVLAWNLVGLLLLVNIVTARSSRRRGSPRSVPTGSTCSSPIRRSSGCPPCSCWRRLQGT
jgi:hypothetical protein